MKAGIIVVGDEILSGRTLDYNSHWLAKRLTSLNVELEEIAVVKDNLDTIKNKIKEFLSKYDLVITTGGLGPTPGDLTLEAVSLATKRKLELNKEALKMVEERLNYLFKHGLISSKNLTRSRKKMALLPQNSKPLINKIGVAPGVLLTVKNKKLINLPGVPAEMIYVFENFIQTKRGFFKAKKAFIQKEIQVEIKDESALAPILRKIMKEFPKLKVKSYPQGFGETLKMNVVLYAEKLPGKEAVETLEEAEKLLKQEIMKMKIRSTSSQKIKFQQGEGV